MSRAELPCHLQHANYTPCDMTTLESLELTHELIVESQTSLPDETELEHQLQHLQRTELYLQAILDRAENLAQDQPNTILISPADRMCKINALTQEIAKYAHMQTKRGTTTTDRKYHDGDKKRTECNTDSIQQCTVIPKIVEGNACKSTSPFFDMPQPDTIPKLIDQHNTKTLIQPNPKNIMINTTHTHSKPDSDSICLPDQTGRATRLTKMATGFNSSEPSPTIIAALSTNKDGKRVNQDNSTSEKQHDLSAVDINLPGISGEHYCMINGAQQFPATVVVPLSPEEVELDSSRLPNSPDAEWAQTNHNNHNHAELNVTSKTVRE